MACLICEHSECSNEHDVEQSHSMVAVLQRVDGQGFTYFQCEEGQDFNFMNWQHWHCSQEHMLANFPVCLNEHYAEEKLHAPEVGTTILHKIVLGSDLKCKACQEPLTSVAYRFCLTVFTPVNHVLDDSLNELGEWCCSLEHAKQSALAIIEKI